MVGEQSRINTNNPRDTMSTMFHFVARQLFSHRATMAAVKHSIRHAQQQSGKIPQQKIARSNQNPSLPQLSHKSTHTRFHSEDRHVAWQRFVASLVASRSCVICLCSTFHKSMNAHAAQHHVARNQSHGAIHHSGTDQILAFSVNHSTVIVQQQTPQQGCRSISPREVGELLEIFLSVVPGALLARRSFERKKRMATRHHTANRRCK